MASEPTEILPAETEIALAHTPQNLRAALRIFFELDMRLGRIVAGTTEPMLGQVRLAWWRDMLGKPALERPNGDVVLDGIALHWQEREADLQPLIDGWEYLLSDTQLTVEDARQATRLKSDALMAVFGQNSETAGTHQGYETAARAWICADFASKVSSAEERQIFLEIAQHSGRPSPALPRPARGLAVLGALGWRAVQAGGRPLMEGRGAALTALRAAMLGR